MTFRIVGTEVRSEKVNLTTFDVPLRTDSHGVIRVGKTRVTLDLVIGAFKRGASPETIASQYTAITLAEVYAVVAYYLQNREEIDEYLQKREIEGEQTRHELEDRFNPVGLKATLLARIDEQRQRKDKK